MTTTKKTSTKKKAPAIKKAPVTKKAPVIKKDLIEEEQKPITQTEYARHRKEKGLKGGTHQAVKKAIDSARLLKCLVIVGKKKMIKNLEQADKEWESKTTPDTQVDQNDPEQAELALAAKHTTSKYTSARARRLEAQAEQEEIILARLKNEVLDLVVARRQITTIGKELSQMHTNVSRSKASEFAAETNPQAMRVMLQTFLKMTARKTIKKLQKVVPSEK